MIDKLEERALMSAKDALDALYFADNSDYVAALHRILMRLDPEMYKEFLRNEAQAFKKMNQKVDSKKVVDQEFYISEESV